ncbi:progestin and adipoQ receptor family member 3 isoform X2 [Ornithorhynchus anatinus]|uniref:progestin and adipoQ receptor family member 3 isoform X2 n=1 Tax=Ornithorhynchus anatinus TaxID=9258 RepID=UPI0010A7728C|nr:progestin and adipoQ receptor family member 3 isoform X2 [Ornithorhynchus anatinus]
MAPKASRSAQSIELGGLPAWPVLVPRGIRLYTFEQAPGFLRDNPYITDGYRAFLPARLCLRSLFILSNETVNIWSHLLGFLLFFTLGIYDMTSVLPSAGASREDFVICSICLFCFQVCMLCSVGYHLFCCHRSEKTSRRWMALDYAGISIGILGCYVSGVFYAFYCNNIHPSYLTQQWHRLRSLIFCSVSGYGVIPTVHWVWLNGGLGAPIVQEFAPRVVVMYMIAASAFLFYISKVPERYFPAVSGDKGDVRRITSARRIWERWRKRRGNTATFLGLTVSQAPGGHSEEENGFLPRREVKADCLGNTRGRVCRPTELPRFQPPDLAHPGRRHALLVASVDRLHHAVPTQQTLPRLPFPSVNSGPVPSARLLLATDSARIPSAAPPTSATSGDSPGARRTPRSPGEPRARPRPAAVEPGGGSPGLGVRGRGF